ncbi:Ig-like domain-containing protein [Geobacter sp. DSM 9736]|uniref:Ig-like domain-containing protein n=1 Tax=Geobacter sp. DSM 9736 TaxID=1277350 RepID=UPI000B50796E|nr:Ig-like domain-containing protein [Geobacter sp. DSM 9736]SNB47394.1 hypothetical protein SAMN06269301_2881 [Geobacter sp. DSM 9736]
MSTRALKLVFSILAAMITSASVAFAALPPEVAVLASTSEGLSTPVRMATDSAGNFYVTDPRQGGILKISHTGRLLKIVPTPKPPQGIAVTADARLVVTQGDFAAIIDGNTGVEVTRLGIGAGQFRMANGVAVDDAGYIYVVDSLDNCVQVFTPAGSPATVFFSSPGKPANSFGSFGSAYGQFVTPTGITYERTSNQLAVVDTRNGRIQFFTTNGDFRKSIGSFGSGPLRFTAPQAIAFEYSKSTLSRAYVLDSFQGLVQAIDPADNGTFLSYIGSYGIGTGKLANPSDLLFDQFDPQNKRLAVLNGRGNLAFYSIDRGVITPTNSVGPALTVNPIPAYTNLAVLAVSGTVTAGATVKVNNVPATVTGTAWSTSVPLAIGVNAISISAADGAGNSTARTAIVVRDATSTQLTVNPVATPTNQAIQVLAGTVDAGGSVKVNGTAATVVGTAWSYTATLTEGVNSLTITAGVGGKRDSSITLNIELQTVAPSMTLSMLPDGSTAAHQVQNVTGNIGSPMLRSVTLNGEPVMVTNGFFSAPVTLVHGPNVITVVATDAAGNSTTAARTLHFDATRQAGLKVTSPDGFITTTNTTTLSGTAEKTSTLLINGNSVPVSSDGNWAATVSLSPGINTFVVSEAYGGKTTTAKRTATFNPAGLQLAMTSPAEDGATNNRKLAVSGTAPADGVTLVSTVNGTTVPVTFSNGTYNFTTDLAAEGTYLITVTAIDAVGTVSTSSRTVYLDVTPPRFTIDPVDSPNPVRMSGTLEPGATLVVKDRSGPIGIVTIGNDGTWSVDLSGVAYDRGTLSISPADPAGNTTQGGDLDGDGTVNLVDAIKALRFAAGVDTATFGDILRGDVAPLRNHVPQPDGVIDINDTILIMRRVVGLSW